MNTGALLTIFPALRPLTNCSRLRRTRPHTSSTRPITRISHPPSPRCLGKSLPSQSSCALLFVRQCVCRREIPRPLSRLVQLLFAFFAGRDGGFAPIRPWLHLAAKGFHMSLRYRSKIFREHFGLGKGNPKRFRHLAFLAGRRRRAGAQLLLRNSMHAAKAVRPVCHLERFSFHPKLRDAGDILTCYH